MKKFIASELSKISVKRAYPIKEKKQLPFDVLINFKSLHFDNKPFKI